MSGASRFSCFRSVQANSLRTSRTGRLTTGITRCCSKRTGMADCFINSLRLKTKTLWVCAQSEIRDGELPRFLGQLGRAGIHLKDGVERSGRIVLRVGAIQPRQRKLGRAELNRAAIGRYDWRPSQSNLRLAARMQCRHLCRAAHFRHMLTAFAFLQRHRPCWNHAR